VPHVPAATFYELIAYGASPLTLAEMRAHLRVRSKTEDDIIQSLINDATAWAEDYTGRSFRENQWRLLIDCFSDRTPLDRAPLLRIDKIDHLVSGSPVTVDAATYHLKKARRFSEVLLADGKYWPVDTDDREQAITITFTTGEFCEGTGRFKQSVKLLVSHLYANRGDCEMNGTAASESGAVGLLGQLRIVRI